MRSFSKAVLSIVLAASLLWFASVAQSGYGTAVAQGESGCQLVGTIQYFMPDGSVWQTDTYDCVYGEVDMTFEAYDPSSGTDLGSYAFQVFAPLAVLEAAVDAVLAGLSGWGFVFLMTAYFAYVIHTAQQSTHEISPPCTVYVETCM